MIKIFLTNLEEYNSGNLCGEWVTLPATEDELKEAFERIGNPEEYFITDYECDIFNLQVDEYDRLDDLNELAEELAELDEEQRECAEALLDAGYEPSDIIDKLDDCIIYEECSDMTDVAMEYCNGYGILDSIPEYLQYYFDYEAYGRDMEIEGTFIFTRFNNCVQIL